MVQRRTPLFLTDPEPEARSTKMLSDPAIRMLFNFGETLTDEPLDRNLVYGIPAVKAAVNKISDAISSLPLIYYTNDPERGQVVADKDPIYNLFSTSVNSASLTANRWIKLMVMDLLLDGRHLAYIERNKAGRVRNIWPLAWSKIIRISVINNQKVYHYQADDGVKVYDGKDVLDFIHAPSPDFPGHINPIESNRDLFGLCRATVRFASKMFANGGLPPAIITGPTMSPAAASRASAEIKLALQHAAQGGDLPVLPDGYDYKVVGFNPKELQLLEIKDAQLREVAQVFGIPPIYLQDYSSGTFNNAEQQDIFFVKHTIVPICELIEAELNTKLSPNSTSFAQFNVDNLLRGDAVAKTNSQRTQIYSGIKTINEVRREYNLPPVKGGDEARIQQATVPLEFAGKLADQPNATQEGQDPVEPGSGEE